VKYQGVVWKSYSLAVARGSLVMVSTSQLYKNKWLGVTISLDTEA